MYHAAWPSLLDDASAAEGARARHLAGSVVVLGLAEPEGFAPGALSSRLFPSPAAPTALSLEGRLELAAAMAAVPVEPTELLVGRLDSANPEERAVAARALGAPCHKRACARLRRAVRDGEVGVRLAALLALPALGDRRASASAIAALEDVDGRVRRAAVGALLSLSGTGVRAALVRAAGDADVDVRCAVLAALMVMGGLEARAVGKGALGDAAAEVRALAVQLLARHGHHDDAAVLADDADPRVQRAVREARRRAVA
ncbi:MAG: HEAT repeat domain-containing protein [Deltaproteobacteria bacterium]|nr:HEAT repeat domain-containing protein [Deltaproteobacteria bacterium]